MSLDRNYFQVLSTEKVGSDFYKIIKPLGSCMVLFSGIDGTPLAALHLVYKGNHPDGNSIIVKRHRGKTDFQGIINKDNAQFSLVISNLTGLGAINFNIMKNDTKVVDVDPGPSKGGLNRVNELHEYQSYEILGDQKNACALILNSVKKTTGENVTIGEREAQDENQNAKYWLSVVPQVDKAELIAKFENTYWACVDAFCIKDYLKGMVTKGDNNFTWGSGYRGTEQRALFNPTSRRYFADMEYAMPQSMSALLSIEEESAIDDIVDNSWSATVGSGNKVEVSGGFSGLTYAFDKYSVPCTIGLSVSKNLVFFPGPSDKELIATAQTMLDDLEKKLYEHYRESITQVYESDSCVVCLENKPDIILYSCGHQCCHKICMGEQKKCPLCRLHITALLNV